MIKVKLRTLALTVLVLLAVLSPGAAQAEPNVSLGNLLDPNFTVQPGLTSFPVLNPDGAPSDWPEYTKITQEILSLGDAVNGGTVDVIPLGSGFSPNFGLGDSAGASNASSESYYYVGNRVTGVDGSKPAIGCTVYLNGLRSILTYDIRYDQRPARITLPRGYRVSIVCPGIEDGARLPLDPNIVYYFQKNGEGQIVLMYS